MNFIQKDPNDPKYDEFHDGQYEFWPVDGGLKSKSISIPAAVVTGLELIAAAAAAGLLAAFLALLSVISSPLAITETNATINANVYNNRDNQLIGYTLATAASPDIILQNGTLTDNKDTLFLNDLSGGTSYILTYYDSGQEPIDTFRFTTPGVSPEPDDPYDPTIAPTVPTSETVPDTLPVAETEAPTEPEATTEPVTEPTVPAYRPPVVPPPSYDPDPPKKPAEKPATEPTTEPPTEPPTEPSTEPTTRPSEPDTEITTEEPDIGTVSYVRQEFGSDENDADFLCEQIHTFRNVSPDFTIDITQDGEPIQEFSYDYSDDGTLKVRFTGELIHVGESSTSTVTVTAGNSSAASSFTLLPPSLDSAELAVTKNEDGTHTFTVTAHIIADDTQEMVCQAQLFTSAADITVITLPMTRISSDRYTASHTCSIKSEEEVEEALAVVTGYWAMIEQGTYAQLTEAICNYIP